MHGISRPSLGFATLLALGLGLVWLVWSIASQLLMAAAIAHLLSDSGHACPRPDTRSAVTAAASLEAPLARSLRPAKS